MSVELAITGGLVILWLLIALRDVILLLLWEVLQVILTAVGSLACIYTFVRFIKWCWVG